MQLLFALALIAGPPPEATSWGNPERKPPGSELQAYLRRPVPRSARFLDHGVIALAGAVGAPHFYRLDLRVGLFDHVSVGVTAHWLPGQRAPQVWPVGSLALVRWMAPTSNIGVEVGGHYRPVLFPPIDFPGSLEMGTFVPQTHLALGTVVLSSGWFSSGLDLGAAHTRIPVVDPNEPESFRRRVVFAGGPFVRAGNRRVGVTGEAIVVLSPTPLLVVEVALELRFGAFEERPPGGWR
jgi:hypothetical protein